MSRSLIVLPDDSAQAILDAIWQRRSHCELKCSSSPTRHCSRRCCRPRQRGVDVRIMLNPARRNGEDDNAESREQLRKGGIQVIDSNPAFDLTHEKSMVVDDESAFVKSLNWDTKTFPKPATTPSSPGTRTKSVKSLSASKPTGIARTSTPARTRT